MSQKDFIWVEKYRPQTIEDTILPPALKSVFKKIIKTGELPNMLFTGSAGLGKTTVAKAICKVLGYDYIIVNCSEDGNIDTLRGKIRRFASTVSLAGGVKVVILDEADYLNAQSTQPALRGFIEEFSDNCRFILTCNFKNRIIEPLHSRCGEYQFNTSKKDMAQLCGQFMKRLQFILDSEGVTYNNEVIGKMIMKHAPDWRRVVNEAQKFSMGGQLETVAIDANNGDAFESLFEHLKAKDFKKMRTWVVNNVDVDASVIFRAVYDMMYDKVSDDGQSIPQLVLILADYQYKNAFVADHELNIVACMTEIMANVSIK
tara:strand:+ start:624 stop:1571 length:948 start_codon:yes stop_codon:yes gene_type:complete